ncbi:hypothetical protein KPZU09_17910 [Klebsiella pneumoniae]|uniref:Oxidoreductase n=1 Tax=Klebsiella pneumoniae TaxID=573 RepID=A0A919HPS6_KLEPN|nr:hypothetical protein KPZU09_17910 [Klebsiella pneumoniae]
MVLTGRRAGMFAREDITALGLAYLRECLQVARAEGAALSDNVPVEIIAGFHRAPADLSTSILIDRLNGRPLEWDIRNGVVQRRGRQHGIPTPLSDIIVPLLAAASDGPADPGWRVCEPLEAGSAMIPTFVVWSQSMFNDAIVYDRYGPPSAVLTLKRLPLAPLAGGRVRVRMRYAPVNPSDLIPVTGAYRHRTRLPAVAGYEGLGEVVAAPYGSRLCAGQRVLPLRGGGTAAVYRSG